MEPSTRPTLKTIAKLTGLAVPTVSRALADSEGISLKTRQKVQTVAAEIGYVPDRTGLRLRTGRTHVIALVLHNEADLMNLTGRLINAAASAVRLTPYNLIVTPYFPDEDIMRPIQHIVETRGADAIIFNQVRPDDIRVKYLMEKEFPFATHGRSQWAAQHAYYDFDNYVFGATAVRDLVARGRKTLRMLAPPAGQNHAEQMTAGAQQQAKDLGVQLRVIEGLNSDDPSDQIEAKIKNVIGDGDPIDGIICASANSCMSVVSGLEQAGLTIGHDIEIYSKESMTFLKRFRPAIHCQYEDAWRAGEFLAKAAIERVEKPDAHPMQFLEVPI